MDKDSITLSEKHGLNPSISVCLLCGKDVGIALFGKLKGDKEAPKKCCTGELCDECKSKLISDKNIVLFDENGRYVIISEKYLIPEGLNAANKSRSLSISSQELDSIIKTD